MKHDLLYSSLLYKVLKEKKIIETVNFDTLTYAQLAILYVVYDLEIKGTNEVSTISYTLGKTMSTISKNLKVLEKEGLISRESKIEDRRIVYISISKEKLNEILKFYECVNQYMEKFYDDLTPKELQFLSKIEDKFNEI